MHNDKIYQAVLDLHKKIDSGHERFEERLDRLETYVTFNKGVTKTVMLSVSIVGILIGAFADGIKVKIGAAATSIARLFA